jgi:hypothetical protein
MGHQENLNNSRISSALFFKSVLTGAGIAFLVISFFVFGIEEPNPEWGQFWRIKPLMLTPLAGGIGGAIFYIMTQRVSRDLPKTLTFPAGIVAYFIVLWLGVVLGLNGTMWD